MKDIIFWLRGKKTYIVLISAFTAAFPGWLESLGDNPQWFAVAVSFVKTFWAYVAGITIKAGLNRNAGGP